MRHWKAWLAIAVGIVLTGCAPSKADTEAAVRRAIEQHLAGRANLNSSDLVMDLKTVEVQGDTAQADVVFHSRSDPKASMDFHYQLHKDGRNWSVDEPRTHVSGSPHGMSDSSDGMPPQMPSGELPAGHPPIGGGEQSSGTR